LGLNTLGLAWDLATITSSQEQAVIQSLIPQINPTGTGVVEYWIGGYQLPGGSEPGGSWVWINNEGTFWNGGSTGMYSNWMGGEPNNSLGGENHLAIDNRYQWKWNDNDPYLIGYIYGYIVESQDPTSVPEPATLLFLGVGLVGLAVIRRRNK
jgi:hypothetical protein